MKIVDSEMENEVGASAGTFDDRFSQSREAVEHATPARLAAVREGERLKAEVSRLSTRLQMLRDHEVGQLALDGAEKELQAAVERWAEFVGEEDESAEVGNELEGYIPLSDLLKLNLDTGKELNEYDMGVRVETFNALLRYVCQDGHANIWLAFKNFLAVTRRAKPEFLNGISKADLAVLLGEKRASTCDREIRVVEKLLKMWGVKGYQLLGGNKTEETRLRCARSAMGNRNRRGGK
ncbi:MAG: hypothetical protein QM496_13820 [Verrucomicrobiota bacterium]